MYVWVIFSWTLQLYWWSDIVFPYLVAGSVMLLDVTLKSLNIVLNWALGRGKGPTKCITLPIGRQTITYYSLEPVHVRYNRATPP
ncbi:hypothetical protein F4778DRAFT_754177 [Xylariomycetidae sp. FL2044]|nr:hypothetical protein F4778DRAFT_754177 [Xylariomycetidae sp. FL2044]